MFTYAKMKIIVWALVAIGGTCAGLVLWHDSLSHPIVWYSPGTWVRIVGAGGTPAAIALWIFQKWAWRWPLVNWVMEVPRIEGTWEGKECSQTFRTREGESRDVVVTIKQSPALIRYLAKNESTRNIGIATWFERIDETDEYRLFVTYRNDRSGDKASERTREHFGTCLLNLYQEQRQRETWVLKGHYWTDKLRDPLDQDSRGTAGVIKLMLRQGKPTAEKEKKEKGDVAN